ncbi:MAG: type IV pilus twitching motility protein PilT [Candidatus Electrothrix aestuarii]|uniref:Type IV pilus twitching motility protein PilT n=1 Tax=Candidatus Electrothrix aestuarii TaxID=3062594 RepID=A0AAU8LUZ7_9BACT|nr:type IV pilus twitching motility protein PilT [Candidatus Electrothrix aestuarii]WPD22025.1 MAG: type IV pilus twitching motility protein PilT [Candidatus Electrothrix sp. GW3-3]
MAIIDSYFTQMKERGASDLHMVIGFPPMLRLRGELVPLDEPVLTPESNKKILFEILDEDQQAAIEKNRDFDKAYALEGVGRFRCNLFYQQRGIGAVFRIIPAKILTVDQLNLPDVVRSFAHYQRGMVLVTGPTGSGKSTTMAAIIDLINDTHAKHIITIEDPLEFVHPNKKCIFSQREIGSHALSFGKALSVANREDPDIILVGEMRDLETISLALTCAELGILVFGTLHTNSAAKTIDRIINAFPADEQAQTRTMLADSLKGVIAQQLLKTKDGKGRCAALEILIGSNALASIIREGKINQIESMIQTGTAQGMQTMDQHLQKLIDDDKITVEAAREKAINKSLFPLPDAETED